ncbi:possible transposase [Nitrosomonas europaea ATCC 19718]|uniref:Possible transposase n=1 Tax=Nitrosomonas europaea (strain ATCC 19718 / CIP 103999 / KCTC 2705 / NBRC 14298) TaxID=228410 RepID=Q82XD7_NITEU|nr:possible transposase [Nitrosomonas europaea ATCC 19718]
MEISASQFKLIENLLPIQRGNVTLSNLEVLNAILYVAEHGCKWRGLPVKFGNWHSIYTRANRWARNGVLDRVFLALQQNKLIQLEVDHMSLDSTIVKVHPDGTGALKKTVFKLSVNHEGAGLPNSSGRGRCQNRGSVFVIPRPGR